MSEAAEAVSTEVEDLKPKKLTNKAPQGMTTFTVCRQSDETGISGDGVVIEGCVFATGHTRHPLANTSTKRKYRFL